jgi:hypothetical protein
MLFKFLKYSMVQADIQRSCDIIIEPIDLQCKHSLVIAKSQQTLRRCQALASACPVLLQRTNQ